MAAANAGLRDWFVEKSLVVLSPWPGVARLNRYALLALCPNNQAVKLNRYDSDLAARTTRHKPQQNNRGFTLRLGYGILNGMHRLGRRPSIWLPPMFRPFRP